MVAEAPKPARVRAFVALDLPDDMRGRLSEWTSAALDDEAVRPTAPDALHLTLCFLGYVEEAEVPRVAAIVRGLRPRPVPMRLAAAPVARPPRRPRLFALEVESPAAEELQAELQAALVKAGLYEPEDRPFWPHLTVARVRTERGKRGRPRRVRAVPGELPRALVRTFGSVRVALYRSNLRPKGAQYVSLASLDLPPAA